MKQKKLNFIGIFVLGEVLLLIATPLLEKLFPLFGVIAAWAWFILPGYLLTYLINRRINWYERVPLGFGLAVGFNAPFTILAIVLRMNLNVYLALTVISFLVSALLYYFFADRLKSDPPNEDLAEPERSNWLQKGLLATLIVIMVVLAFLALTWPPSGDDLAGLPLYAEVLDQDKIVGQEPFHGTGTPVTPRNELVVWGYQTTMLAKLGDIDPAYLLVGSRGVLIVLSFMAVYGFISQWFQDRSFSLLAVNVWGLYLMGSLQFDEDGSNFVTRIFQDKFLGWFVIIPALLVLFLWYVEKGDKWELISLTVGAFGIALLHPVTFTIMLILIAGYSILHLYFNWSRQERIKFGWLILALGLCLVVPAIQYVRYMGPMPIEQAGLGGAVDFSRYRMAAGRFRLFLLDSGGFVLHPKVITQQFVFISLIASLFLVKDVKKNRGIMLLLGSLVLLSVLLYTPIFAFLVGKFVTPFLIWRLAWPYSLLSLIVLCMVSIKGLGWLAARIKFEKVTAWMQRGGIVMVFTAALLIAIPNIQSGLKNLTERLAEEQYSICAKAEDALAAASEYAVERSINLLASQKLNLCIPGTIGLANVIEYRGLGTVNRLPFEQIEESYQRVEDSDYFSNAIRVDDRIVEILKTYEIDYLLLSRDRMEMELQLKELPDFFELVFEDDQFDLFAVSLPLEVPLVVEGNSALRQRDWEAARDIFSRALEEDPDQVLTELGLAEAHIGLGEYDKALEILLEAGQKFPDSSVVQIEIADTYLVLRNIELAAVHYQNALDLAPARGKLYYSLGALQFLIDQEQAAYTSFESGAAFFAKPGTANFYEEIARQLFVQRRFSQSIPYYQKALNKAPTIELYVDYAEALFQVGDLGRAISASNAAIRINPWNYQPYYQLGRVYRSQNKLTSAAAMYRQAIWLDPTDSGIYVDLAEVLQELVGVESAIAELEDMNRGSRELPGPPAGLIPLYIMQGNPQRALDQYDLLGTLLPRSTSIEVAQGFMMVEIGAFDDAGELFEETLVEHPDLISPTMGLAKLFSLSDQVSQELEQRLQITRQLPMSSWPHISLAIAYNRLGQWEEALDEFEFAVKLNPSWSATYSALADYYMSRGEWDLALETYLEALDLGTDGNDLQKKIAQVYWHQGKLTRAEEYLVEAIKINPNDRTAYLDLSRLYWQQGFAGQAMSTLDSLKEKGFESISSVAPLVEAYMMQGRVDQVGLIYDEIIAAGHLHPEFPDWTNPELPLASDSGYAIEMISEFEREAVSFSVVLRNAAQFFYSQGQIDKAEEILIMSKSSEQADAFASIGMAEFHLVQGARDEAIADLEQGLQAFPDSAELYSKLGEVYSQSGDYDQAEELFKKAIEVDPSLSAGYTKLAVLYQFRGDFDRAENVLKTGLEKNPTSIDLSLSLSSLYVFEGELDLAEQVLLQAYDQAPTDVVVVMELASVNQKLGNQNEVEKLLTKALALEPQNSEVYIALGSYLDSQADHSHAVAAYQTAVNINLAGVQPRLELGEYYKNIGDYSNAQQIYNEIIEYQPGNPAGYLAMGNFMLQTRELDQALEYFQTACDLDQNNMECVLGQGQVLAAKGDFDEALSIYDQAISLYPGAYEGYAALAEAYQMQDDLEMAEFTLTNGVNASVEKSKAFYSRAKYYQEKGDFSQAELDFHSSLDYWPGAISYEMEYAKLLKQENKYDMALDILDGLADQYSLTCSIGLEMADNYSLKLDWADALRVLEDTVQANPICVDAYQGLAQIHKAMGQVEDIYEYYLEAVGASPDNPRSYVNLGDIYSNRMDFQDAENSYKQALLLNPRNLNALLGLETARLIQHQDGDFDFVALDQSTIGKDPNYLIVFALLYQDYNQWEKANEYLTYLRSVDEKNPLVWYGLGKQYAHELDWEAAQDAYQSSLLYSPDSLDTLVALGEAQIELELFDQAEETYQRLLAYFPGKADGYLALADLYLIRGDHDRALDILEQGISNAAADSRVYDSLGKLHFNLTNLSEAKAVFLAGLEAVPGSPNLYSGLGDYYSWSINGLVDDLQRAEATVWWYGYLMRRLESFEDSIRGKKPPALASRRNEINRLYQTGVKELESVEAALVNANEDIEAAKSAYQTALGLNPGNEDALLGLARIEAMTGSLDTAIGYYEQAVAANPNSIVSLNRLGFAYLEYQDPASALPIFERSVSLEPGEVLGLIGRFRSLIEIGDWGVVGGSRITKSAQFWWGNLVDRLRVTAFEGTQYNPYLGVQQKMEIDSVEIEIDVPEDWGVEQSIFDYSLVRTYTSPDSHAMIQLVVFDDSKQVNRSLALLFALVLMDETYTDSLYVESNEILADRENLVWQAEEQGYRGVTGFTVNSGSIAVLTYLYDDEFEGEYAEMLDTIARDTQLGDLFYP